MATHADIGVSQPAASTITMKVATLTLTRNSTAQHQELLTIADGETTNGLARVLSTRPGSTEFGLVVRQALGALQSTALSSCGASTASGVLSSATTTPYVSAISITSTSAGPINGGFYSSNVLLWPVMLWADGGVPAVAQSVSPPGFLFRGRADHPVTFNVDSTVAVGSLRLGITWWVE